jgi:polyphosphate kinase 2 (PPK2 family)
LHISKEEQRKRLEERMNDPSKQWKVSKSDITERKLWKNYTVAYQDIINRCSNLWAPWYIIPANKKWFRNLVVALVIVDTLERMKPKFPKPTINLSKMTIDI